MLSLCRETTRPATKLASVLHTAALLSSAMTPECCQVTLPLRRFRTTLKHEPTCPSAGSEGLGGRRSASEASIAVHAPPRLMRVRAGLGVRKAECSAAPRTTS
jgi:hypothetical protein